MRAAKKNARVAKALAETVSPDVAKHSTYRKRTVYVPPSECNDNAGYFQVSENIDINLMDSWLFNDPAFDGRHLRSARRCRSLWDCMPRPSRKPVEGHAHARAARTLLAMKRAVGPDWVVFENALRWNEPMGYLGSRFAEPKPAYIEATKAIVRRVLESMK